MPDSCVSKEVSYSLSTNLQVILSQQARKRTQNVLQPFPGHEIDFDQERDEKYFLSATSLKYPHRKSAIMFLDKSLWQLEIYGSI